MLKKVYEKPQVKAAVDAQLKQVGQGINKVVTILTNMSKTQLGIWTGGVLLGAGFFEAYSHDVKMKAQVEIDKAKKTQIEQFVKEKIKRLKDKKIKRLKD